MSNDEAIPTTPIFPHRCIFDPRDQYKLYSSNWFQNVVGVISFINEEVKGRTLADVKYVSPSCQRLYNLFVALEEQVSRVPPISQRSRFGNLAYRTWLDHAREIILPFMDELVENSGALPSGFGTQHWSQFVQDQLDKYPTMYLPSSSPPAPLFVNGKPINTAPPAPATTATVPVMGAALGGTFPLPRAQPDPALSQQHEAHSCSLSQELAGQLLDSFGSYKRVDYGTGHELAFVAFLAALLQVGVLRYDDMLAVALVVFARYLRLVRVLQRVYWLEPAGSKGVWGLDDYQFLPFLWGSAQLYGAEIAPTEGANGVEADLSFGPGHVPVSAMFSDQAFLSQRTTPCFALDKAYTLPPATDTTPVAVAAPVASDDFLAQFSVPGDSSVRYPGLLLADAVAFVCACKTGPLEVHSPTLCSLATLPTWSAANGGLARMYGGEVLAKFPVVQHILFGSLLRLDAAAAPFWLAEARAVVSQRPESHQTPQDARDARDPRPAPPSSLPHACLPPLAWLLQAFAISPDLTAAPARAPSFLQQ